MIRDLSLIRDIMIDIEKNQVNKAYVPNVDNVSEEILHAHIKIIHQQGFVDVIDGTNKERQYFFVKNITPEGYDFLSDIENDTRWNKIKNYLSDKGLELTFESIKLAIAAVFTKMAS